MGVKNGDKLFHGTSGNPQQSLEQEEFAINNNGGNGNNHQTQAHPKPLNGTDFNIANSKSVKRVDEIIKISVHSLPITSKPNSVIQNFKNSILVSERYFDENGQVYLDIDYTNHGNSKIHPVVPHEHTYTFENGNPIRSIWKEIKK